MAFILAVFFTIIPFAAAGNGTGAVFVYTNTNGGNDASFTFALNADAGTKDLYMHMSAPTGNSWMAVGIGSQMAGSLIFVAYPSSNGSSITLSPRIATGHSEPSYTTDIHCDLINGNSSLPNSNAVTGAVQSHHGGPPGSDTSSDGYMILDAVCHNVSAWNGGSLSLPSASDSTTKNQDFIFAVGPSTPIASDSTTASMRRHDFYGQFTMDLAVATSNSAGVPVPNGGSSGNYTAVGASAASNTVEDNDPAPAIHGFLMTLSFVILFPLGSLILRVFNKVLAHAWVQGIALLFVTFGSAGGIYMSTMYNKSKNFASAHQIIGILLWLALVAQLTMGILQHRVFKREQRKTILNKIHLYLGPAIILFGIVNGGIGLNFANESFVGLPYAVIVIAVAIGYSAIRTCVHFRRKRRAPKAPGPEGYQHPQFNAGPQGGPYGAPGGGYYAPPPYALSRGQSENDIPLRAYESQHSGIDHSGAQQQPRPMV